MIIETLKSLFTRDLEKLKIEIQSYKNEEKMWIIDAGISNSAGNLCLHLIGNLNHFIGATLGNTGYIRNRPLEFSDKNVPKLELIKSVDELISTINNTLDKLSEGQLRSDYPLEVFEYTTSTEYFLVHLTAHLNYHLGQINYHRRMLDK